MSEALVYLWEKVEKVTKSLSLYTGTAKLFVVLTSVQLQMEATTKLHCSSNSSE